MSTPAERAPATADALLGRTLRRQRRSLAGSVALITSWQVCETLVPVLIGVFIDRAVATGDVRQLLLWGAAFCLLFAVLSCSYRGGSRIFMRAMQRESHALRTEVAAHVLDPRGARTDRLPGEILTLATADADLVGQVVRQLSLSAAAIIGLAVSAVALATIDALVATVVLVGVPVVLMLTQALSRPLERRTAARQESVGRATGIATDLVRGLRPLKGIGAEDAALVGYRRESRRAAGRSVAAARWEGLTYGVTDALSGAFLAAVALLAGLRALQGELSIGELVAVVGLAQFIAEPLALLSYLVAQVAQSRAAAGRIVDFLAGPPLVLAGERTSTGAPVLEVHRVTHGPLVDVSFAAAPGELVAVVAEDPADAAGLMSLWHGEAAPAAGAARLGGVPLTEQPVAEVRARLLVTDHHVDLFEGTLGTNVDPAGRVLPGRLAEVLAATTADDVVAHHPGGLAEPVAVGGTTLSGGQAQRVALARALAADTDVLVLHDPTTAVDAVTEQRIADGLAGLRHPPGSTRTTVVLTSSPALLARAHRVVHLRAGRVVGVGTHRELAADPAYRSAVLR